MNSVSSFTLDVETAATLREWLFEKAGEKHGESDISEPLAELAAAIDGELHEQAESIELGAGARTVPPTDRDASIDAINSVKEERSAETRTRAEPDSLDEEACDPNRIYDTLPDSAWQLDHDESATDQDPVSTSAHHNRRTSASSPHTRRQTHRSSVLYRTAYECSVCGTVRELETSLRVCAFVDECTSCGTVARFKATEIPTSHKKD